MATNVRNPPLLEDSSSFENWEKALKYWQIVSSLTSEQQGPAIVLTLKGKAQEAVLELGVKEINAKDGVDKILIKLGEIYKKDTVDTAYEAFEQFIYFKREPGMDINSFINEFERRYSKAKEHDCVLSSSTLGFFLLNQAKLSEDHKKLVRATITKLEFPEMKTKLKKIFTSNDKKSSTSGELDMLKIEDVNLAEEEDVLYGQYNKYYHKPTRGDYRGSMRGSYSGGSVRGNYSGGSMRGSYSGGSSRGNYSGGSNRGFPTGRGGHFGNDPTRGKSLNRFDKRWNKVRCSFCQSICHQTYDCPDKIYFNTEEEDCENHDIVLYESNLLTDEEYCTFVAESTMSAILDSGATANVAGESWFNAYYEGLTDEQQKSVSYSESKRSFKFGSGKMFPSMYQVKVPAKIGSTTLFICTDVVQTDVPLLLSKEAMKNAGTEINFVNDTVIMFGENQKVNLTKAGHYAIPLNDSKQILRRLKKKTDAKVTLFVRKEDAEDKEKIAKKLHFQFAHPTKGKLLKLIERAGLGGDRKLVQAIDKVYDECRICIEYKKPTPTPAVGLPHATKFNETVAMDLKFFNGKIILHLIDHLTRFSSAIVCKSKEPKEIISGIIKAWIGIFGPPEKFLTDNGGEFANAHFLELAESFNIRVMSTAAESPWSNGLVERHNATLAEMLQKIVEEQKTTLEVALAWAIQAKNSMANVHGFSPAQLAIGYTPMVPSVLSDDPPALETREGDDIISENLNCMKLAREAFIKAESSERIKRALRHNIRPSASNKFYSGDTVYYKRNDSRKWKGPGKVIGSDSSNILIKHGSSYVRAHVCRVMLDKGYRENIDDQEGSTEEEEAEKSSGADEDSNTPNGSNENQLNEMSPSGQENTVGNELEEHNPSTQNENHSPVAAKRFSRGSEIAFKLKGGDWEEGVVMKRSGKATGKYKDYWYINCGKTGEIKEFNVADDWETWKFKNESDAFYTLVDEHEIFCVEQCLKTEMSDEVEEAKQKEMDSWQEQEVFEEVTEANQVRLSTTWVITTKMRDDNIQTKARLVVRGYEEDDKDIRSDSPTCLKENIRLLLTLAVSKEWDVNTLDIKAAFLQGKKIERDLFVTPPKEFRKPNILWKLNKVVYGLCDASRSWYLRIVEVLTNLGMNVSRFDKAVFTYGERMLEGVLLVHVDDVLYFGSEKFIEEVIAPFKDTFHISREERNAFKYLGVELKQVPDGIILAQHDYLKSMNDELLPKEDMKDKSRLASKEEQRMFRKGIGQLGWITSISKPEGAFMYCLLSTVQSRPKIEDFVRYKKIVRELKNCDSAIMFRKMDLMSIQLSVFSDASFANLEGGGSQLGYIIFITDKHGTSAPITWASKKAKRVARSTLTAETLSAVEAVDNALCSKTILEETLRKKIPPITLFVDNKSLYDTAKTTNSLMDKRLLIDMSALREMMDRGELVMKWIRAENQLADALTKAGADKRKLTDALSLGHLSMD